MPPQANSDGNAPALTCAAAGAFPEPRSYTWLPASPGRWLQVLHPDLGASSVGSRGSLPTTLPGSLGRLLPACLRGSRRHAAHAAGGPRGLEPLDHGVPVTMPETPRAPHR